MHQLRIKNIILFKKSTLLILPSMEKSKKHTREQIKKIIIDVLKPLGVLRIGLFGSFARKEDSINDIDILLTLPGINNRKTIGMR